MAHSMPCRCTDSALAVSSSSAPAARSASMRAAARSHQRRAASVPSEYVATVARSRARWAFVTLGLRRQLPGERAERLEVTPVDELEGGPDEQLVGLGRLADHRQVVVRRHQVTTGAPEDRGAAVQPQPLLGVARAELDLHQLAEQVVEAHRAGPRVDDRQEHPAPQQLAHDPGALGADEVGAQVGIEPLEHRQRQGDVALVLGHRLQHLGGEVVGEQPVGARQQVGRRALERRRRDGPAAPCAARSATPPHAG